MTALWLSIVLLPLLPALLLAGPKAMRQLALRLVPWVGVPAILTALWATPDHFVTIPWLMHETRMGLDATGQVFFLLTAVLWTLGAIYGKAYLRDDPRRERFWVFYLLAMTGNLALVPCQDMLGFYLFFVLMTLASFGLVVHEDTRFAHFAGKVYIAMAVIGEVILLTGMLLAVQAAGGTDLAQVRGALAQDKAAVAPVLLFVGFGIKAGAMLLHMWLPLAHPAAPTPASAVLSGAMIKAGLLGWMRFLPAGELAMPIGGSLVIGLGLAAAFFGAIIGALQIQPKSNLAYSSISQMGFMTVGMGVGLVHPQTWPIVAPTVALYALHHSFAKGTLFLGVGLASSAAHTIWRCRMLMLGLALPAVALAGAPLTSGYLAKAALKGAIGELGGPWHFWLDLLLPVAAVGTTVLLGRYLYLVYPRSHPPAAAEVKRGLWPPWLALLAAVALVSWLVPQWYALELARPDAVTWGGLWLSIWPVLLGAVMVAIGVRYGQSVTARWEVPPGDVVVLFLRWTRWIVQRWRYVIVPVSTRSARRLIRFRNRLLLKVTRLMMRGEAGLLRWGTGGVLFLLVVMVLSLLLIWLQT